MSKYSPPVFYYHSVAPERQKDWVLNSLTFSLDTFEDQLKYLTRHKLRTIFLDDFSDIREGIKEAEGNEICLTFDDGYLDNWVYAWPLAKKYGARFTLFVSPECVDPRSIVRPTLEDVWKGNCKTGDLDVRGYLSWDELRAMQASGIVDIQSHTMSHTKYITTDMVTGFYYGGYRGVYPTWNAHPGTKPYYMADANFQNRIPLGYPLFEEKSAVIAHKKVINPQLFAALKDLSDRYDLRQMQLRASYEAEAGKIIHHYRELDHLVIAEENEEEYLQRLHYEVVSSKIEIEKNLNKPVHFLCWPHGDNTLQAHALGRSVGYRATTSGKLNEESTKMDRIPRMGGDFENGAWISRQKFHFKIHNHYQRQPYRSIRYMYDVTHRLLNRG